MKGILTQEDPKLQRKKIIDFYIEELLNNRVMKKLN